MSRNAQALPSSLRAILLVASEIRSKGLALGAGALSLFTLGSNIGTDQKLRSATDTAVKFTFRPLIMDSPKLVFLPRS